MAICVVRPRWESREEPCPELEYASDIVWPHFVWPKVKLPLSESIPGSVHHQMEKLRSMKPISKLDSDEERTLKLEALFALSDTAIAEGMETLTQDRILAEVAENRGVKKQGLR